jgi:hypothetical protein
VAEGGPFRYRQDVLDALAGHGIRPTARSSPDLVREYVRELYKYEIRRLRERLLAGAFPRGAYAERVSMLRSRYGVLALLPRQFLEAGSALGERDGEQM